MLVGPSITFAGNPAAGQASVSMIVRGPQLTPDQVGMVGAAYDRFRQDQRLGLPKFVVRDRVLSDGSHLRIVSNNGIDTLIVTPVVVDRRPEVRPFVAYPAFVSLAYSPVFDRFVFDGTTEENPYPPPPEYDPPVFEPPPEPLGTGYGIGITQVSWPAGGVVYISEAYFVVRDLDTNIVTRTLLATAAEPTALWGFGSRGTFSKFDQGINLALPINPSDTWAREMVDPAGDPFDDENLWYPAVPTLSSGVNWGPDWENPGPIFEYTADEDVPHDVTPTNDLWLAMQPLAQAEEDYNDALHEAYLLEYAAALAAHEAELAAYNASYNAALEAWTSAYGDPSDYDSAAIRVKRQEHRPAQIETLNEFLEQGLVGPHLVARFLSFPFNIRTKPVLTLAAGGTIEEGEEVVDEEDEDHKLQPITFTDAMHLTAHPDGYELGRDVALPTSLYGWELNGEAEQYQSYYAFHESEEREVRPIDLGTLTFTERDGYTDFANGGFEPSEATDERINSDAYVPPGTTVTIVLLEWEIWDPYIEDWTWLPVTELTQMDSIWIKVLGPHALPGLPTPPEPSPRKFRIRGAWRQKREESWSWSAPTAVELPDDATQEVDVPEVWVESVFAKPSAIVIVERLAKQAAPNPAGTSSFPFEATYLWSEQPQEIREQLQTPWLDSSGYDKLTAEVLALIGKVKVAA